MASKGGPSEYDRLNPGSTQTNPAGAAAHPETPDGSAGKHTHDDEAGSNDKPGGQKPEKVEDRPNVSTVTPGDYPPGLPDH